MKGKGSIKIWAVAVWLVVWEVAARLLNKEIFLVSPIKAIMRFAELAITGSFWLSIASSLMRIALGFLLAVAIGVLLAILSHKNKRVREFFAPVMLAIRTVPVASFIILALICFSSKYLAILISFLIVNPTIFENVFTGIQEADNELIEMSCVFNLTLGKRARYIYWPSVYPYFRSACKTAIGMAWKAGIAAEVIGTPKPSIGAMLQQAKIYLETVDLIAWTIGIVIVSLCMEKVFIWVLAKVDASLRSFPKSSHGIFVLNNSSGPERNPDVLDNESEQHSGPYASEDAAPAVELKSLTKSFGEQKVIDNLSFVFPVGEISTIMGQSGVGKTTLARIIAGLETPDGGEVRRLTTPRIAIVFQEDRLLDYMTAEDNIRLVNEELTTEEVQSAMQSVGLIDFDKHVSEYSGGMKRRVSILRALLAVNAVILLDEPFKGLDEETKAKTIDYIKTKTHGKTVIVITHDKEEAEAIGADNYLYL